MKATPLDEATLSKACEQTAALIILHLCATNSIKAHAFLSEQGKIATIVREQFNKLVDA